MGLREVSTWSAPFLDAPLQSLFYLFIIDLQVRGQFRQGGRGLDKLGQEQI